MRPGKNIHAENPAVLRGTIVLPHTGIVAKIEIIRQIAGTDKTWLFCLRRPGALFEKTAPGPRKNFLLGRFLTPYFLPVFSRLPIFPLFPLCPLWLKKIKALAVMSG
jgi:hypothetical protein